MREMTVEPNIENLGIPNIEIAGLKIWTHSRKYPESERFWDVNWLNSTFHCSATGASVWVSGDILHNTEIADWLVELEKLDKTLLGEANLKTMERCINVKIVPKTYQRISIKVDIAPDRVFQKHYFEFWLDQHSLKDLIENCREILVKFPIKGKK
jgi:hypothetical protein